MLNLDDVVSVSVNVSSSSTASSDFNLGLIIGTKSVIGLNERVRLYSKVSDMLTDGFTTTDPEYIAATLYFSQSPKPAKVAIGRRSDFETITAALNACRIANNDWYSFLICGATKAQIIEADTYASEADPACVQFYTTHDSDVLTGADGNIFKTLNSSSSKRSIGQYSTYGNATAGYETGGAGASTDISAGTATTFKISVDGDVTPKVITLGSVAGLNTGNLIAEALQEAIQAEGAAYLDVTVNFSNGKYVITSATKGASSSVVVTAGDTNDLTDTLKLSVAHGATDTQGTGSYYDSAAGIMGYAMGANTKLANSAYTLAYKTVVGITTEGVTATQLANIKKYNGNVYISRGNSYTVFEQGVLADGTPFDELINLDLLKNEIQMAIMDILTAVAKIPQTEDGVTLLVGAITTPCNTGVSRGFIAPGIWNAADILTLNKGDTLSSGYAILAESIDSQSEEDRTSRIAPPIYVAAKLAGAIEHVVVAITVNE